jgi:hypothetical protein
MFEAKDYVLKAGSIPKFNFAQYATSGESLDILAGSPGKKPKLSGDNLTEPPVTRTPPCTPSRRRPPGYSGSWRSHRGRPPSTSSSSPSQTSSRITAEASPIPETSQYREGRLTKPGRHTPRQARTGTRPPDTTGTTRRSSSSPSKDSITCQASQLNNGKTVEWPEGEADRPSLEPHAAICSVQDIRKGGEHQSLPSSSLSAKPLPPATEYPDSQSSECFTSTWHIQPSSPAPEEEIQVSNQDQDHPDVKNKETTKLTRKHEESASHSHKPQYSPERPSYPDESGTKLCTIASTASAHSTRGSDKVLTNHPGSLPFNFDAPEFSKGASKKGIGAPQGIQLQGMISHITNLGGKPLHCTGAASFKPITGGKTTNQVERNRMSQARNLERGRLGMNTEEHQNTNSPGTNHLQQTQGTAANQPQALRRS